MDKILPSQNAAPVFSLDKYGYTLDTALNNSNRWDIKIVCKILDKAFSPYVSTTYIKEYDYLKFLETTLFLKCKDKLFPRIVSLYPEDKTVICEYIGEFMQDYLLNNLSRIYLSLISVYEYLKDINSIGQDSKNFITPSIIKTSLELTEELGSDFEFLSRVRSILPKLENSNIEFAYGYGIEDPHIWNFRIIETQDKIKALTTDFDYFSDNVNCFWELGYLYATFRWLYKILPAPARRAEEVLVTIIQGYDLKAEFMFWLGALSSYCGYKDSIVNFLTNKDISDIRKECGVIKKLDEKVSFLAEKLLNGKEMAKDGDSD